MSQVYVIVDKDNEILGVFTDYARVATMVKNYGKLSGVTVKEYTLNSLKIPLEKFCSNKVLSASTSTTWTTYSEEA